MFFLLDANFEPLYLARLLPILLKFSGLIACRAMLSYHILLDENSHPILVIPLLVKFSDPLCQMGLALTMSNRVSKMGWFESRYFEMVQHTFHLLFNCK